MQAGQADGRYGRGARGRGSARIRWRKFGLTETLPRIEDDPATAIRGGIAVAWTEIAMPLERWLPMRAGLNKSARMGWVFDHLTLGLSTSPATSC